MKTMRMLWNQYIDDCYKLAEIIKKDIETGVIEKITDDEYKPLTYFAVPRGGLIPGVIISHVLSGCSKEVDMLNYSGAAADVDFVVDDLVDSGRTFISLKGPSGGKKRFYALYNKGYPKEDRLITLRDLPKDCWIKFPYENDQSMLCEDMSRYE